MRRGTRGAAALLQAMVMLAAASDGTAAQEPRAAAAPATARPAAGAVVQAATAAPALARLELVASRDNSYAEIKVGRYEPQAQLPATLGQVRPAEAWKPKALGVSLLAEPVAAGGCATGQGAIEAALTLPNQRTPRQCVMTLELTFQIDKARAYRATASCQEWRDNVSACSIDGDGGQFWVTRDTSSAPRRFNLVLGPSRNDVRFPPDTGRTQHAVRVVAAGAGRVRDAAGPVWVTWPEKALILKYSR